MGSNNSVTVEAKTLEQAIVMACGKLGVAQADLQYEVLKKSSGFLNLFGGKVQISAWVKQQQPSRGKRPENDQRAGAQADQRKQRPRNGGQSQQGGNRRDNNKGGGRQDHRNDRNDQRRDARHTERPERREERTPPEPLTPDVQEKVIAELREFCADICSKIIEAPVSVEATFDTEQNRLNLQIDSQEVGKLIQEQIKFVEGLEHLLRKKPRHIKQDLPFRIFIDAHGGRKGREEELARLAAEWSQQVVETHKPMVLNYRSAADRKIIHMALENDNRVYTKSIGSGPNRKLMILPSRGSREDRPAEA